MHPVISIGFYLIAQCIALFLAYWCVKHTRNWSSGSKAFRKALKVLIVLFIVFLMLPVLGAMLPDSGFKFLLQAAGNIWLGFDVYFCGSLWIFGIICGMLQQVLGHGKRAFWAAPILYLSLAASLVLFVYGVIHAQNTVVKKYDVTIGKEVEGLTDLKAVLIADLHLSVNSNLPMIQRAVDLINEQQPDVVLIAGDIFTSSYNGLKDPEKYAAVLREIRSRYGTYAVYGNHDVEETLFGGFPISPISEAFRTSQMEQFFKDCGFHVLYDETVTIADGAVQITGRVDGEKAGDGTSLRKSPSQVLADADQSKPVIVLQHEPVEFQKLKESGADLVLCGHTHAGQIFPGNLIVPFFNENAYGFKNVSGVDTIVTAGIGYYGPPMRVGTDSEITVVNIHFASHGHKSVLDSAFSV